MGEGLTTDVVGGSLVVGTTETPADGSCWAGVAEGWRL